MAFPSIRISVGADVSRLGRDLKKGESIVGSFGKAARGAMLGVASAAAGAAIAIGVQGVKAAIEDEAAQSKLNKTLENVVGATKQQTAAVEEYISKTTMATGITDDELRPSLDRLIRSTKDVTKAQQLQSIAMNLSVGTGTSLEKATAAIAKAYDGNFGALKRLGVPLSDAIVKSKDFNRVQQVLEKTFSGQLDASLDTQAGKLKVLNTRWNEMQENIGYVLLEGLEPLMDWASGPEGQKFMNEFMLAFKDAAVATAKALPGILESIKKIGETASSMGLNFDGFLSPELLAAGAAFVAMPGPPYLKAMAGLIAYAGVLQAKQGGVTSQDKAAQANRNMLTGVAAGGFSGGFYDGGGATATNWVGQTFTRQQVADIQAKQAGLDKAAAFSHSVTINGVLDPQQAAIAVQRALNQSARMKVGNVNINAVSY